MLESFAHFVGWKERSIGAVFFRNAFLPKIHWLHDMLIRRDNDTIDTLTVTITRRHIFILPILLVLVFSILDRSLCDSGTCCQLYVSRHLKSNPRRYRRVICKSNPQRRVGYGKEN